MKTLASYLLAGAMVLAATSCSDFEPTGFTPAPELATVNDLTAEVDGLNINLTWSLPSVQDIEGVLLITDGNQNAPQTLPADATSYTVVGQPMEKEVLYTVKLRYADNYVSEGVSVYATLPAIELPAPTALEAAIEGRTVTLTWTLPTAAEGVTAVKVRRDGVVVSTLEPGATSCALPAQPMDRDLTYEVALTYYGYYDSPAATVSTLVPYFASKAAFLMLAPTIDELDDDEQAAARWFLTQEDTEPVYPEQLATLNPEIYSVLWIMVDRMGLNTGWTNLPAPLNDQATVDALKAYSAAGGNLYLSNMATQLAPALGFVSEDMIPTVWGSGEGGEGSDIWTINPYLGWDFQSGSDQGFYDRTAHVFFNGLTLEQVNDYPYNSLPMIGPGHREDHNSLWDCNPAGKGNYADVIKNFEMTYNCLVVATWGHVRDHCVAGLVEFYATETHARCVANGFAAYEWNQNSGENPYQGNIEKLTANILSSLK